MTTGEPYPYEPPPQRHSGGTPDEAPPQRRSRLGSLLALGVAAWAVLEIWLLTVVADAAGGLTVLALIVAGFVLGAIAIKRAGRRAWRELAEAVQSGQSGTDRGASQQAPPRRPRTSGTGNALAMLGGLLLMLPGLISDGTGLLLVFPPTASLLRRVTGRFLTRGSRFAPGSLGDAFDQVRTAGEQARIHRPDGKVVQGEVVREEGDGGEQGEKRS